MLIVLSFASLLSSCRSPDPVELQRKRNLNADERYLVEYYIKIIEFEKEQFETLEQKEARRKELETEFDMERLRKVLSELAKDPRRWLAIYYRINEIQTAGRHSSERY